MHLKYIEISFLWGSGGHPDLAKFSTVNQNWTEVHSEHPDLTQGWGVCIWQYKTQNHSPTLSNDLWTVPKCKVRLIFDTKKPNKECRMWWLSSQCGCLMCHSLTNIIMCRCHFRCGVCEIHQSTMYIICQREAERLWVSSRLQDQCQIPGCR